MGCFNIACGISGATIDENDRFGAVLIRKKNDKSVYPNGFVSNYENNRRVEQFFMTSDLYIPVAPPVYGTYDDYGGFATIEQSPVTEFLENEFGMPVETLFRVLNSDGLTHLSKDEKGFFYDFENENVQYIFDNEFTELKNVEFERLGWSLIDNGKGVEWTFNQENNDKFFSFDPSELSHFIEMNVWRGKDGRESAKTFTLVANHLSSFVESFNTLSGVWLGMSADKSCAFESVQELSFMPFFSEIFETVKTLCDKDSLFRYSLKDFDDAVNFLNADRGVIESVKYDFDVISLIQQFRLDDAVDLRTANALQSVADMPLEWKELLYLYETMRKVNRIYSPTNTIKQGSDYSAELAIGNFLIESANTKIAKYELDD